LTGAKKEGFQAKVRPTNEMNVLTTKKDKTRKNRKTYRHATVEARGAQSQEKKRKVRENGGGKERNELPGI